MLFDFDSPVERRGTGCMKWDEDPSVDLPLWVADMDFKACPAIVEALERRVAHGVFGYSMPQHEYYESIIRWHAQRHGGHYEKEWILCVPGIVPAISAILRAMTSPGEGVLLLSPAYNCFYSSIRNLGCRAEESKLQRVGDSFRIDWADFEARASKPDVTLFLLCSPHNPCGRVWTEEELRRMAEICSRHNVFVVADEIHCEVVMPGKRFVPYSSLGADFMRSACICTSASKAFNIAGLQNAQIVCADAETRRKIDRAVNIHEICDVNPFGIVATEAAYTAAGAEWIDALCRYIWANYETACTYLHENLPQLEPCRLEGTYLMWVDVSTLGLGVEELCSRLRAEQHVWFAPGTGYGTGGEGYIRINLATQRQNVTQALERLTAFVKKLHA